ncbi:mRNA capping enzyme, catalytic domain-containing protein [Xylogone sp. PMI_703]|nr:mRNA capping enzyme, catalytic domain-containing protein [Xylogone sp. PMI_703]
MDGIIEFRYKRKDEAWPAKFRVEPLLEASLQRDVAWYLSKQNASRFPGSQPVSMKSSHIECLQQYDYYISEKSDGRRFLLYLTCAITGSPELYLVNRRNEYYLVNDESFPVSMRQQSAFQDTLLDGELVMEMEYSIENSYNSSGTKFLVFDCLLHNGACCMHQTLPMRLQKAHSAVKNMARNDTISATSAERLFNVELKEMKPSRELQSLFERVLPALTHPTDGIIFTPVRLPYISGMNKALLKWKPRDCTTIDFLLSIDKSIARETMTNTDISRPAVSASSKVALAWEGKAESICRVPKIIPKLDLLVYKGNGEYENFGEMKISPQERRDWNFSKTNINRQIVECALNADGTWQFKRFRTDKAHANHIRTALDVMECLKREVSMRDLLDACTMRRKA